jgi:sec-independent protein translocase protein TatA
MLGLDNPIHIAFLLILLLLVFGAKRLPEMGKSLGAGMRGFKDSLTGESNQPTSRATASAPVAALPAAPAVTAAPTVAAAPAVAPSPAAAVTPVPVAPVAAPMPAVVEPQAPTAD